MSSTFYHWWRHDLIFTILTSWSYLPLCRHDLLLTIVTSCSVTQLPLWRHDLLLSYHCDVMIYYLFTIVTSWSVTYHYDVITCYRWLQFAGYVVVYVTPGWVGEWDVESVRTWITGGVGQELGNPGSGYSHVHQLHLHPVWRLGQTSLQNPRSLPKRPRKSSTRRHPQPLTHTHPNHPPYTPTLHTHTPNHPHPPSHSPTHDKTMFYRVWLYVLSYVLSYFFRR